MTIQAVIDKIDSLKPNTIPYHEKLAWLSELDGKVFREIYMTHEGMPAGIEFHGYDQDTNPATTLLIPDGYTDVYQHYLAAEIDNVNRETNEYTKDKIRFANSWQTFCDYWTRTHMPKQEMCEFRL